MTAFFTIADGPISAFGRITESSITLWLYTRTFENSTERRTAEPLTMQPPETTESIAVPRQLSSSKTNFAGGIWSW